MNDWYQRMVATLQLNGKGERTQQAYTRSVRMLSQFYDKTPDLISEPELQEYFLHRKNVNRWSPKTMRICYCGIRFFYVNVLERDWHILSILRAQNEHRLPAVLSVEEVRSEARRKEPHQGDRDDADDECVLDSGLPLVVTKIETVLEPHEQLSHADFTPPHWREAPPALHGRPCTANSETRQCTT